MKQEMMEWQWHHLDHIQIISTLARHNSVKGLKANRMHNESNYSFAGALGDWLLLLNVNSAEYVLFMAAQ